MQKSSIFEYCQVIALGFDHLQFFPCDLNAAPVGSGDAHTITSLWSTAAH